VQNALSQTGGNKKKAARLLGVGRATLYRFLGEHPDVS
jgi:transcriptional regulator of acetoin/glycerol metabolism